MAETLDPHGPVKREYSRDHGTIHSPGWPQAIQLVPGHREDWLRRPAFCFRSGIVNSQRRHPQYSSGYVLQMQEYPLLRPPKRQEKT